MKVRSLVLHVAVALGVGTLAGFLSRGSAQMYDTVARPPLSPPAIVFPVVWSILYVLMGISASLIRDAQPDHVRTRALVLYGLQLAVNFVWPLLFFIAQLYWAAFWWLLLLWALALWMVLTFFSIRPVAAVLQLPYMLWLTFAAYLSLGVAMLNG